MASPTPQVEPIDLARRRLAQTAIDHGVRLRMDPDGHWYATSVSRPGEWHYLTGYSCDCFGFSRLQRCLHHSALLASLGWLPERDPADPVPMTDALASGKEHLHLAGDDLARCRRTTILINDVPRVQITSEADRLRVDWLKDGLPIVDLTACTPHGLGHGPAVAYWLRLLDCQAAVLALSQVASSRDADAPADAA